MPRVYYSICSSHVLLASGRMGNALAVALERKKFKTAVFLFQNALELNLDLEAVSYDLNNESDVWNVEKSFLCSVQDFSFKKIEDLEMEMRNSAQRDYLERYNATIDNALQLKYRIDARNETLKHS